MCYDYDVRVNLNIPIFRQQNKTHLSVTCYTSAMHADVMCFQDFQAYYYCCLACLLAYCVALLGLLACCKKYKRPKVALDRILNSTQLFSSKCWRFARELIVCLYIFAHNISSYVYIVVHASCTNTMRTWIVWHKNNVCESYHCLVFTHHGSWAHDI